MIIQDNVVTATIALANFAASGAIGTAAATVDLASSIVITQTTAAIALTLPSPTDTTDGLELTIINASASTQSLTVGGIVLVPGALGIFKWAASGWASIQSGLRNMGISVTQAVTAGLSTVTHNLAMPAGKLSSLIFRAYNAAGTEVVFKRNKAADTANVLGISSVTAMTAITFDVVPLA
jgi:hypothetical protein